MRGPWHLCTRVAGLAGLLLLTVSAPSFGQRVLGIDVSQFQGTIDWPQVLASGRQFAFIRATHGSLNDTKFSVNMPGAKQAGVLCGAYHFAVPVYDSNYGLDGADPETEATRFLNVARNYLTAGYLRPVLDLELGGGQVPVGATSLSAWANAWIESVKRQTGVEAIVYCNSNYAKNYLNSALASRTLWIANWTYPSDPNTATPTGGTGIWSTWTFWQYSNSGNTSGNPSVGGISARVDLDVFNGTMAQLQTYLITPPGLIVRSPASLTLSARQHATGPTGSFTVRNGGGGTMSFDITSNQTWLFANPPAGTSAGETDTIAVNCVTTGLKVGAYTGTLSITSTSASNSPQAVGVTLNILPIPGDLTQDGYIDSSDASVLAACLTGSGRGPVSGDCAGADLDSDHDVDQSDFALMQKCFSGTGIAADPYCLP
jgi:GH25 family lysozyme M1 (1,4-beta-N-acetylmuramidase)